MLLNKSFFSFIFKVLQFLLLIPPSGSRGALRALYRLVAVPHFTLLSLVAVLEGANLFWGKEDKFSSNILNLGTVILHAMALNRVIRWFFIRNEYFKVLDKLMEISDGFRDYSILLREYHDKVMVNTGKRCQRIVLSLLVFVPVNLFFTYFFNLLNPVTLRWNEGLNKTSTYRDYPYPFWYPFDTSLSDGYYWLGFFYQLYAFQFLISGFFCVDWLCTCTIIHLTSLTKVLRRSFQLVDGSLPVGLPRETILVIKEKRLSYCMEKLSQIYECATLLNNTFSSQLLTQEICMAGVVCCCVYRVTEKTSTVEAGTLSTIVSAAFMELFTVSWFNHNFTLEVFKILREIERLDWLNYNVKLRKMLVFLTMRIQKPFYFTMGLGIPLDMKVFMTMVKTSYSLYTLITQSVESGNVLKKPE